MLEARPSTPPRFGLSLTWLVRLRWITVVCQALAILIGARLLPEGLPVLPLLALVGFGALSNVILWLRLARPAPVKRSLPGMILALDSLLLTALLFGSGGPSNPFTAIYLVHITLAAVVMGGGWAWFLGILATAGFGLLFFWNVPNHTLMGHGAGGMSLHLTGMWIAFAITAGLIAAFVGRVTEALRQRDEEVAALRDLNARHARLAALTTLAAGVAHELSTPLGTIAVAARELIRAAQDAGSQPREILQDATLIREEVGRCRRILDQMAGPSSATLGEDFQSFPWREAETDLLEGCSAETQARVAFHWPGARSGALPRNGFIRALRALLANALEATRGSGRVQVTVQAGPGLWRVEVVDDGVGMTPEVLARAGEPFFSTRAPGTGMGLGLFLARTFAEQLGGGLTVASLPGQGTTATLTWPRVDHA